MRKQGINAIIIGIIALLAVISGLFAAFASHQYWNLIWVLAIIIWAGIFFHTVSRGHAQILADLLKRLGMSKNAQVLDSGAGRLADLKLIANQLEAPGKVTGVAEWGQSLAAAKQEVANARLADRAKVVDAGMTNLPFASRSFDCVIIDSTLHNITPSIQRGRVLQEASRVLKVTGALVVVDTKLMEEYRQVLANVGFTDIKILPTGFNGWWGGPWLTTKVLIAKRA